MKTIIGTNVTTEDIYVTDLASQFFGVSEPVTISDLYTVGEISLSTELEDHVVNERIILNNGLTDLPTEAAIKLLNNDQTQSITELIDVPDIDEDENNVSVVYDGTAFIWHEHLTRNSTGIEFALSDHAASDYVATGTTAWTSIRTFTYSGSDVWTPVSFVVIGSLSKSGATATARLLDYTNNNVICEVSWSAVDKTIHSTTTINNLANNTSIIELQVNTSKKGTEARTHYVSLY